MESSDRIAPPALVRWLLWIDGLAGLIVGVVVITLAGWLSGWYGLPYRVLLFTGVMNLVYASYSLSLAARRVRPMGLILLLVVANLAWVPVCLTLAYVHRETATLLGLGHLLGEAAFVGGLAAIEYRLRESLQAG